MPKVLIVGGGPAGSACAITTARAGLETVLFEKGSPGRDKVCGDCLLPESQRVLSLLGVSEKVREHGLIVDNNIIHLYNGKRLDLKVQNLNLQRRVFDQILRDQVECVGGIVNYEQDIVDINATNDHVEVENKNGVTYRGDVVVLATGAQTNLAKKLGFVFDTPNLVAAIRGYSENTFGLKDNIFYMGNDFTGYGWIFPCPGDTLNVGFGTYDSRNSVKSLFSKFIEEKIKTLSPAFQFIDKPKGFPIRIGMSNPEFCSDRVLLIGENIDCAYDLTGDGIGPAMKSGIIAGDIICNAKSPYDIEQFRDYESMLKREMNSTHKNFTLIRKFLNNNLGHYLFTTILSSSGIARDIFSKYVSRA
ncbi:MAG TPA: NAD(P)/FAD-dependent oxidoreductase [Candidatus Nanoarchaeia archaeon]|nr:NAD(P)/FAD-dependent oxidoreductase [Candidatus Nanoarchaeia archaeon]